MCGDSYAAKIVPFLKALLFHRSTHLHFHFVVDSAAMPALKTAWEGMGERASERAFPVLYMHPYL